MNNFKQKRKVLIVDDEPLALQSIRIALENFQQIEIAGECTNGFDAVKMVKEMKPDILFLDIKMPKLDGFDVIELLGDDTPFIVFVTAYDEYAIKAFEARAVDYLLKPVKVERLAKTLDQIEERIHSKYILPLETIIQDHQKNNLPLKRILIREGSKIHIIPASSIFCIEAQENYVSIHTKEGSYLKNESMSNLISLLDNKVFCQVHRSYIINVNYLSKIEHYSKDSREAIMKNEKTIPISRSGYSRLMELLA
jgi:two-component system LytT family response regulator